MPYQQQVIGGCGVVVETTLPVTVSMTQPAAPTTLEVTMGGEEGGKPWRCLFPVLAVQTTLQRVYTRRKSGGCADPPRFATHREMIKAGWVARELRDQRDLVFYHRGGLMTLAEFKVAYPGVSVLVLCDE
jgi:hypothetical protein